MKTKTRELLRDIGWGLAMALGLYSVTHLVIDLSKGRRVTIELDSPWPVVADALQLAALVSLCGLWSAWNVSPRPSILATPWLWTLVSATALRFAWEWYWGFACWPRSTRFGRWLDRHLPH